MHAQVHVASFGFIDRTSTSTALNQWVSDAVALVPLLVMLILRTGRFSIKIWYGACELSCGALLYSN